MPETFTIQAWPQSEDCPYPGINDDNADEILDLGINSVFADSGNCGTPTDTAEHLADTGASMKVSIKKKYADHVKNRSAISSIFIGDEVDGKMDENLRDTTPAESHRDFPEIPTYVRFVRSSLSLSLSSHSLYCVPKRIAHSLTHDLLV